MEKKKFFVSSKFSMLDPFLHIDVAPVEHKSPIAHSEVNAEALQFSLEPSNLQLFDLICLLLLEAPQWKLLEKFGRDT